MRIIPEGATHQWSANGLFAKQCPGETWAIWQNNQWLWIGDDFSGEMIERQKQPKAWSGPEDGLPPVGMTVQVWDKEPHKFYAKHVGKSVSILAHRIGSYGEEVAVYCVKADDGTDEYHALVENCFRPIQSEPDARETAIRELMDIAQVDCRVTAARLVDAGFKREGV